MIVKTKSNCENEPLAAPFGFKGGYVNDIMQTCALMENESGQTGLGIGVQSVLWSDAPVFEKYGQVKGNEAMYKITQYALNAAKGTDFSSPLELLEYLLPKAHAFGKNYMN